MAVEYDWISLSNRVALMRRAVERAEAHERLHLAMLLDLFWKTYLLEMRRLAATVHRTAGGSRVP